MLKKTKMILFSSIAILLGLAATTGIATPIIVNNVQNSVAKIKNQSKLIYDNKLFNDINEVVNYYLTKNDVLNDGLYFGKASDAIYDHTNGFLEIAKLKQLDYNKVSNAYLNAYGGYEKTKIDALKTFINETRIITKYSDYNGGLFYDYRDALDSLRSKTTGYQVINSRVIDNKGKNHFINLTNKDDQEFLKEIAYSQGINSTKNDDRFKVNYYFNDENIKSSKQINIENDTYTKLGNLNNIDVAKNMSENLFKNSLVKTLKNRIGYKVTLRAKKSGLADYDFFTGSTDKRITNNWWNNREIVLNDINFNYAPSFSYFNDFMQRGALHNIHKFWGSGKQNCCKVNSVGTNKYVTFGINKPINNYKDIMNEDTSTVMTFDFTLPWRVKDHYHYKHGWWFGPDGYETGIFERGSDSFMWFDVSISEPSFYLLDTKKDESESKVRLNVNDDKIDQLKELLKIVINDFYMNTINEVNRNEESKAAYELFLYALFETLKDNNDFMTAFKNVINQFATYSPFTSNFNGSIDSGWSTYTRRGTANFEKNIANNLNDLKEPQIKEINLELIINILKKIIPVITYDNVPLYKIDINKLLDSIDFSQLKSFTIKNSFQLMIKYFFDLKKEINPNEYLINVSQNTDINQDTRISSEQKNLYKINKFENIWSNNFVGFAPIYLPQVYIDEKSSRLSTISPESNINRIVNQILYYYRSRTNNDYLDYRDIPLLFEGSLYNNLYISSYLGSSSETNVSLSKNNISLYNTKDDEIKAIANMASLEPSKISQIIGPNGDPINIGSSPDSDGFFNSFENVLINAGYEFLVKPSTSYIFYENELISNEVNNIYSLTFNNKNLYFVDFNKLKSYLAEILKLEVQYVN